MPFWCEMCAKVQDCFFPSSFSRISFYTNIQFLHRFNSVAVDAVVKMMKKKKVGRVVSLNIDLQGISELDRDVVIAPRRKTIKTLLMLMSRVALLRCCAKFLHEKYIKMSNFLIRFLRWRCYSYVAIKGLKKTRFFFVAFTVRLLLMS